MKNIIITMALVALFGTPDAIAQSASKETSVGSNIYGTVPEAPVGHRQPRASDLKNATDDIQAVKLPDLLAKENAMLDKKMKSICRGC